MIPRRQIPFGRLLPWLFALVCACGWAWATLGLWVERAAARHMGASNAFHRALLRHAGCIRRQAVIATAQAQAQRWQVAQHSPVGWRGGGAAWTPGWP